MRCLWYDGTAIEAAQFYARTFPGSRVGAVRRAPGDYRSGKQGDVLTVEFSAIGMPCIGLNGGPTFPHTEAFSFQVATEDQARHRHHRGGPARLTTAAGGAVRQQSLAAGTTVTPCS